MGSEATWKLGVLTSHPIQYQAPLFRALSERVDLHVHFAHRASGDNQAEAGFGVGFDWDVDLTSGYANSFLRNIAKRPSISRFDGCDTPEVVRCIAAGGYDAFLVFGWHLKAYLQAARACRRLGVPVLARTDSHLEAPRSLAKRAIKALLYPFFLRRFDAFLPTGSRAGDYLLRYGISADRIFVVPYCVDVERFRRQAAVARHHKRQAVRAGWGVNPGERVLLFVGKLIECKRPADLLSAVRRLAQLGVSARAVFVGAGRLEADLKRQAEGQGVPAHFAGFKNQTEMPAIYAAADVMVLPSESETWGLSVNEAFACGLPAVVSDAVGCTPDMIDEGLTGSVFRVGDVAGLATAVLGLASDGREAARSAALAEKSAQYSPARSADAVVEAMRGLLACKGTR